MSKPKQTMSKAEMRQFAMWMSIFQMLPEIERTAIQYYLKGRADALTSNVEIPINLVEAKGAGQVEAAAAV